MSKGKKKQRGGQHRKHERAEQKENFFGKIKSICSAVGNPEAYHLIQRDQLEILYRLRGLPFKIVAAPGEQIPGEVLRRIRFLFPESLKQEKVPLLKNGPEISLAEFLSAAAQFRLYLLNLEGNQFHTAGCLKKALDAFASFEEGAKAVRDRMLFIMAILGYGITDLNSRVYWLEWKMTLRRYDPFGYENFVLLHSYIPEKKYFTFDNAQRPAAKACWSLPMSTKIECSTVEPAVLGLPTGSFDHPLDVYIQSHALKRLSERIDCVIAEILNLELYFAMTQIKARREKDGSILIEYTLKGTKAGYFVADIQENTIVVRTFLFVTNGGTPEGKRLHEICGLGRFDREFLAIDKLSTFMATDIKSDKELEKLFLEAGCGCLIELHDKVAILNTKEDMASAMPLLKKYFGVDSRWDFLMPDSLEKFRRKFEGE